MGKALLCSADSDRPREMGQAFPFIKAFCREVDNHGKIFETDLSTSALLPWAEGWSGECPVIVPGESPATHFFLFAGNGKEVGWCVEKSAKNQRGVVSLWKPMPCVLPDGEFRDREMPGEGMGNEVGKIVCDGLGKREESYANVNQENRGIEGEN